MLIGDEGIEPPILTIWETYLSTQYLHNIIPQQKNGGGVESK